MKLSHFAKILAGNNAVKISENLIIFNDYELYDMAEDASKNYDSLDALVADNGDVKKIIEEAPYFELEWRGGRGASASDKEMGGGFSNSPNGKDHSYTMRNAELNFDTAKWPTKYDYNKGADWWLKKNQRTYGYKYSSTKLIGE